MRHPKKSIRGMTLVELMVAIAVMSIILSTCGVFMVNFMISWNRSREMTDDQAMVRQAMLAIIKDIRTIEEPQLIFNESLTSTDPAYRVVTMVDGRSALCRVRFAPSGNERVVIAYNVTGSVVQNANGDAVITLTGRNGLPVSSVIKFRRNISIDTGP